MKIAPVKKEIFPGQVLTSDGDVFTVNNPRAGHIVTDGTGKGYARPPAKSFPTMPTRQGRPRPLVLKRSRPKLTDFGAYLIWLKPESWVAVDLDLYVFAVDSSDVLLYEVSWMNNYNSNRSVWLNDDDTRGDDQKSDSDVSFRFNERTLANFTEFAFQEETPHTSGNTTTISVGNWLPGQTVFEMDVENTGTATADFTITVKFGGVIAYTTTETSIASDEVRSLSHTFDWTLWPYETYNDYKNMTIEVEGASNATLTTDLERSLIGTDVKKLHVGVDIFTIKDETGAFLPLDFEGLLQYITPEIKIRTGKTIIDVTFPDNDQTEQIVGYYDLTTNEWVEDYNYPGFWL